MASRSASLVDMENDQAHRHRLCPTHPARKLLGLALHADNGFVVRKAEGSSPTPARQAGDERQIARRRRPRCPVRDVATTFAIIGENRKLLVFPALRKSRNDRGKGVRLQRYLRTVGKGDIKTFAMAAGLTCRIRPGRTLRGHERNGGMAGGTGAGAGRGRRRAFRRTGEAWFRGPTPLGAESAV